MVKEEVNYLWVRTRSYGIISDIGKYGAAIVFVAASLLWYFQNSFIYPSKFPEGSRKEVWKPSRFGMNEFEDVELETPDKVKIKAYLILQGAAEGKQETEAPKRPTVLMLHANAGNMGHRLPIAATFYRLLKLNVMLVSYRGYGLSQGSPSEKGIKLDAQTALDYIVSHPLLEHTKVILYGQSIGGALAIHLASQNQQRVNAVIVENTFWSLKQVVHHVAPFLGLFLFLINQHWESGALISKFRSDLPFLFLSGDRDDLVLPEHMDNLFEACSSEIKVLKNFEEGTHNDTCLQIGYFEHIASFLRTKVFSEEEAAVKATDISAEKPKPEETWAAEGAEAGSRVPPLP